MKLILHWPLASTTNNGAAEGSSYLCSILTILSFTPPSTVHSHSPQFHTVFAPASWAWPPATSGAGSPLKFSANLLTSPSPLIGSSPACVRMLGSSAHVLNNNERKFRVKTPLSSLLLLRTKSLVWTIIVPARGPLTLARVGTGLSPLPSVTMITLLSHPQ